MAAQPTGSDWWSNFKPDPLHPPKYCPQCAWGGELSKVKKFKMVQGSQEWVLMCKNATCPWPFSVMSPAEVTVKSETLPENTAGQKRKIEVVDGNSLNNSSGKEKKVKTLKVSGEDVTNRHSEEVGQPEKNGEVKTDLNQNIVSQKCSSAGSSEVVLEWSDVGDSATFEAATTSENNPYKALAEKTADSSTYDENGVSSSRLKAKRRKRQCLKLNKSKVGFPRSMVNELTKQCVEDQLTPVQEQPIPSSDIDTAGVVPSPPPARGPLSHAQLRMTKSLHSRLISAPSWSSENIRRLSSIASPLALPRVPVSSRSTTLVDVVTSADTARSLFDIDGPGVSVEGVFVYLGSIDAGSSGICVSEELSELINDAIVHPVRPARTYRRVQRKPNVIINPTMTSPGDKHRLNPGQDLEADVCDNVNLVRPPNFATYTLLDMDVDFATVKKLGSGVTLDMELRLLLKDETLEDIRLNPNDKEGNCLLFHVSKDTMTTQPTLQDNLNVKKQGSTRVFLTASSDQVELAELRKEGERYIKYGRGSGRGRKSICCRGGKKGDRGGEVGKQSANRTCGKGWFVWRDWRIDEKFMLDFTAFLDSLLSKWDPPKNLEVDSRIQALLTEKEEVMEHPETIEKEISFFASVYVKYIFIQTSYPTLSMDTLMNILQKHHRLENEQFALEIHSLMKQNELPSPERLASNHPHSGLNREDTAKNKQLEPVIDATMKDYSHVCSTEASSSNSKPPQLILVQQPRVLRTSSPPLDSPPEQASFLDVLLQNDLLVENTHQLNDLSQLPTSVYSDSFCSVQVDSAPPYTLLDDVGQGSKLVQFFYSNQETDTSMVFPPVRVNTDKEVKYVVALVTEKAEEYNMKHNVKEGLKPQILYSTEAAMARSVLDSKIVKHIKKCFTKNGMKALKPKRLKTVKNLTKKKIIIKVPRRKSAHDELENIDGDLNEAGGTVDEDINLATNNLSEEVNENISKEVEEALKEEIVESLNGEVEITPNEEVDNTRVKEVDKTPVEEVDKSSVSEIYNALVGEIDDEVQENAGKKVDNSNGAEDQHMNHLEEVEKTEDFTVVILDELVEEEHVPTTEELRLELELKLFGGHLPKVVHQVKALRGGTSDRKGRGGRNEFDKTIASESVKLGAVKYMLACKQRGDQEPWPKPDFNLAALCRKRRSMRKKISIDFDDLSDEDDEDYKVPNIYNRKSDKIDEQNRRKSGRLSEHQVRVESGEYFVAENHDFDNSLGYFWQDHHQPRYQISEENLSSKAHDQPSDAATPSFDPDSPAESQSSQDDVSDLIKMEPSQSCALQQVGKDASVKICNPTSVDEWVAGKTISKVSENYLRNSKKSAKVGVFDQVYTRKRNCRKVRKLFRKLKMGENQLTRKYKGFEKVRKHKKIRMRKLMTLGGKVSQEEKNLMKELLEIGRFAIEASNPTSATDVSLCSDTSLETIREFEELQTLAVDDDASSDVNTLLQLTF